MGGYGSYYKGERRKLSKEQLIKRIKRVPKIIQIPNVEIVGKKKR